MAGPWEKYQSQPEVQPAESGPWSRFQQQPVAAPQEEPGFLEQVSNVFTGADRETRATQELPELQNSGLLAGLDIPEGQAAGIASTIATMTNPEEIAQLLQSVSPAIGIQQDEKGNIIAANNRTGARAVINKPGVSALDAAQLGALTAAFTPAGRATRIIGGGIARQAATLGAGSALTQAMIEAGQEAAGGEFNTADVAASGLVGAAAPAVAGAVGRTIDVGRNLIRGQPAAQNELVQAARQANIPLMTSDVAQPTTFVGKSAQALGERIPVAGTGGMRATQQEARQQAIRELGAAYPDPSPQAVVDSLKAQTNKIKSAAGQRYEQLVPKVDQAGAAPYANTSKAIDDALTELSKPGVVTSDDAIRELVQFRDTLGSAQQTYSTLQANRTALREAIDSYDGAARSQMPSRAKSLLNKVYSSLSSDMDDAARATLTPLEFRKLKDAQAVWRDEAQKLTRTRLKTILDKGDMTPEVAETMVFSKKPSEVKNLYGSLGNEGRQSMRAMIVNKAIRDAGGIEDVSAERFLNSMNKMQAQTGIAFKGDDKKQLMGLVKVLEATKRAARSGVQTPTGQELYAPGAAALLGSMIGFGAAITTGAAIGTVARTYESAAVRNALIRIGSAPNSSAAKNLALKLARDINAGVQSARPQPGEE